MRGLEILVPVAASASVLIAPPLASPAQVQTLRLPITAPHSGLRAVDVTKVSSSTPPSRLPSTTTASGRHDVFTTADLAVLEAVDRARAQDDDLDYTGLFDYDDD